MRRLTPEGSVLSAVRDLLDACGVWHKRMSVGAFHVGKRFVKMNDAGMADILSTPIQRNVLIPLPLILWVETKSNTGRQSASQKAFQQEVESQGHHYLLCRDVRELENWLRNHGCLGKRR